MKKEGRRSTARIPTGTTQRPRQEHHRTRSSNTTCTRPTILITRTIIPLPTTMKWDRTGLHPAWACIHRRTIHSTTLLLLLRTILITTT